MPRLRRIDRHAFLPALEYAFASIGRRREQKPMNQIPDITSTELKAINRPQLDAGNMFYADLIDSRVITHRAQADLELERNKVKDLNQ